MVPFLGHMTGYFQRLQEMRSAGDLVDVTLCAEGKELPCHRVVLSALSDYFRAMFCRGHGESKKDKIEIGGVSADALQLLVDFAYTSKITITDDNIEPLFEAANMLQVEPVEDKCEKFLTNSLEYDTCLGIWALADKLSRESLVEQARSYALKKFPRVRTTEEFLQLPVEFLKKYLTDVGLHAFEEKEVVDAIKLWAEHNLEERRPHLRELMECVCFSYMYKSDIRYIRETDEVFAGVPGIAELMEDESRHAQPRHIQLQDLLVLGGLTYSEKHGTRANNDMFLLSPHCDSLDCWQSMPDSLEDNEGSAVCVVGDEVFVTGGSTYKSQAWKLKVTEINATWIPLGPLKTGRMWHGMVALDGTVYVVGGETSEQERRLRSVEIYCEDRNSWKKIKALKEGVSNFAIASCCGKAYVFGGDPGFGDRTNYLQCYDPTQNEWTFPAPLPRMLMRIRACTVNSKIYLVGGQLNYVLRYDPQQDCYEKMADRLEPWDGCGAFVCGSEIFVTGGRENIDNNKKYYTTHAKVQCYHVNCDVMSVFTVKDLPIPLHGHHTVTIPKPNFFLDDDDDDDVLLFPGLTDFSY